MTTTNKFQKIFTIRMPLCLADIYLPTHCFGTEKLLGRGLENIVYEITAGTITGYFNKTDMAIVGATGLEKLKDTEFVEKIKKSGQQAGQALWDYSHYLEAINLFNLTDQELANAYTTQLQLIRAVYAHFNLSSPAISIALEAAIDEGLAALGYVPAKIREIKTLFLSTQPKTLLDQEETDLRLLGDKARAVPELRHIFTALPPEKSIPLLIRRFPQFYHQLTAHFEKYNFLQGYVNFQTFDKQYYLHRLREYLTTPPPTPFIAPGQSQTEMRENLPSELQHLLHIANYFSADRMNKRIDYTKGLVVLKKIIDEAARRMNWGVDDTCYLLSEELQKFLQTGTIVDKEIVRLRTEYSILLIENKIVRLLIGAEAWQYAKEYLPEKNITSVKEARGTIGSPGIVRGRVIRFIEENNLIKKMQTMRVGDILITSNTRPDMIVACRKAAAIVTDEGGILSHAALVSREFGIPCVIGTKEATRIFQDGDIIEVDADHGVVRLIECP